MRVNDFTIYSIIKRNAKVLPKHVAFAWEKKHITFQEFKNRVNRLAAGFVDNGIKKGDRIGIIAKNSIEYFRLYSCLLRT